MATETLSVSQYSAPAFPAAEVERRLRIELEKIAEQGSKLRPEWVPLLDSKRVVGTVLVIEDLFPGIKIPPDKVVRKGGYNSVDEAIEDMLGRIKQRLGRADKAKGVQMSKDRDKRTDDKDDDRKSLGERLREAREYLGFSQDQVATFLGVSRSALSLMESGQRKVDALELKKLAGLYKRSVGYFTGEQEDASFGSRRQASGPQGRPNCRPRIGRNWGGLPTFCGRGSRRRRGEPWRPAMTS